MLDGPRSGGSTQLTNLAHMRSSNKHPSVVFLYVWKGVLQWQVILGYTGWGVLVFIAR